MSTLKLHNPPLYTAATAVYPYSDSLEKHFVVKTKFDPEPIFLAKKVGDYLHVPRELAPIGEDRRSYGTKIEVNCTTDFKPDIYEVQKGLYDESLYQLKQGVSHTMVALMGLGKSYLFTRLLCALGRTTLIVVTKEDLMKQWKDNLLKYTDIKEEDIGIIRQGICQVKGKKVVIGLVHSLSCREYPDYIYSYFGLVACDEAHRMSCDYFSEVMFKFNSYLRIALTATPHRPDGKSFVFKAHIGEVLSSSDHVQISPKVLVVRTNWKLPKWKVKDEFTGLYKMVDMTVPKGKPAVVSKHMAISETRNNLLVDLCFKAYNKDRKIVMFFDSLKHIEIIKMKLLALGIPPAEILKYVGGIKKADVEAVHTKRILLATYTYMSEGTDVPFLDTAILCSPRSNVSQAVGRILRKVEGKKEPVIMDVIDPCSKDIMESFESRVRQYKKLNAIIVDVS